MKRSLYIFTLCLLHSSLYGQVTFRAMLINKADSSAMPFTMVTIADINKEGITDEKGIFEIALPANRKTVEMIITGIGSKETVKYTRTFSHLEKIYVDVMPQSLDDFKLVGLSAEDVVKKAIAAIPDNYADSSYFAWSSYRQYDQVNSNFCNLMEVKPVVMFRLTKTKKEITSKEAFAVKQLRKTKFIYNPGNLPPDNDLKELMKDEPLYHLSESSLYPGMLNKYLFYFDTTAKQAGDYVIRYVCNTSSTETHGVENYHELAGSFLGESQERGCLVIDRATFAIRHMERNALRSPGYSYYGKPNLLIPERKYFAEFISGQLVADYTKINGRWYLQKLDYKYTNELFRAHTGQKDYMITSYYEWALDSVSRYVTGDLVNKFYNDVPDHTDSYDEGAWSKIRFPYYFTKKEDVYKDLEKSGPVELQFYKACITK